MPKWINRKNASGMKLKYENKYFVHICCNLLFKELCLKILIVTINEIFFPASLIFSLNNSITFIFCRTLFGIQILVLGHFGLGIIYSDRANFFRDCGIFF